jgi:hypothetical protein
MVSEVSQWSEKEVKGSIMIVTWLMITSVTMLIPATLSDHPAPPYRIDMARKPRCKPAHSDGLVAAVIGAVDTRKPRAGLPGGFIRLCGIRTHCRR